MKLNNKGWGTLEMFLLCGGLLIALLVAVFFISKLYGSIENSTKNKQYFDLETKLESAAMEYIKDYSISIHDGYRISLDTLKKYNYISDFSDYDNNPCSGYVIINILDNITHYDGFVSCKEFKSNNY